MSQDRQHWEFDTARSESHETILVRMAKAGDREAFCRLVEFYEKSIFRLVYYRTYSQMDSEDLSQEIFLKAFEKLSNLREPRHFRQWLFKIALNRVRDFKRKMKMPLFSGSDTGNEAEEKIHEKGYYNPEAHASMNRVEFWAQLRTFLKKLSHREREVFLLRFVDELHISEIAEVLKKSESTVKTHLYRAIHKFKNEQDFVAFLQGGIHEV